MIYASRIHLADTAKGLRVRANLLREGTFSYRGKPVTITKSQLEQFAADLKDPNMWPELPMDINHQDPNFAISKGWIKDLEVKTDKQGRAVLVSYIEPTPGMVKPLKDKEIKYVSASIDPSWEDRKTGRRRMALRGAGWTNVPHMTGLGEAEIINFSDLNFADDGMSPDNAEDVDSDALPDGGASGLPKLSEAKDHDATNEALPNQCRECMLLFQGQCPFPTVEIKMAAAGDGNCPRYESYDSQTSFPENNHHQEDGMATGTTPNTGQNMSLADLQANFIELSATLENQKNVIETLTTQLAHERDQRLNLSDGAVRATDARTVEKLLNNGIISHGEVVKFESLLNRIRGRKGLITLSDISDNQQIELADDKSAEQEFLEFFSEMEPRFPTNEQIAVGGPQGLQFASTRNGGGDEFERRVAEREKELTKDPSRANLSRGSLYGIAARDVAAEMGGRR